ncbi:site-specific integrase [Ureibacillus chungkukjangi]|uniref:Core-binding (CB) domain-containing protein n=1 Tax=Ureibacillus chungkukjangi TaxID=1202712 RepID=A0A318TH23_9BACL|nr:site-specific integrase [Ureibacillus chungkukjangi]PYF03974.1 hypothetical protein BJ095_1262 [Ureibacillus chungkukjangi]
MRFVVREFEVPIINSKRTEKTIGIGLNYKGLIFPSPLSNFIKKEYRRYGNSLKSQENAARTITRFLNFHFEKNKDELQIKGLSALSLQDAADYLSHRSLLQKNSELSMETVLQDLLYLNKFYKWLITSNLIVDNGLESPDEQEIRKLRKVIEANGDLFKEIDLEIEFPSRNKSLRHLHDFGDKRVELMTRFIIVAIEVDPFIALGIVLQFFGGLRRSEVINMTTNSFKQINRNLVAKIRDNQSLLFPHATNTTDVQVKKPRDQVIWNTRIVEVLYQRHQELRSRYNLKHEALFFSPYNKQPLRGKSYTDRFNNVKEVFLKQILEEGLVDEYLMLTNNKWSTHIGRGLFTNLLVSYKLSPTQIQLARGDNQVNSSQTYVDEATFISAINIAINDFKQLEILIR